MHNTHVSCERIVTRKGLLFTAMRALHLLLAVFVNGVLVSGQIVGARESSVAGLASRGVDAAALVRKNKTELLLIRCRP